MAAECGDLATGDATVNDVMLHIFTTCDVENRNSVRVSKLIEYITQFMPENLSDLLELKNALNPNSEDSEIDFTTFNKVMEEWIRKFNEDGNNFESSFQEISPNGFLKVDDKCFQSTPRSSLGARPFKCFGNILLNDSVNASLSHSFVDNGQAVGLDKTDLEEKINDLIHQNKKYTDELNIVKMQLASTEEQNEVLQVDLEDLKKKLAHEKEMNERINEPQENEDLQDIANNSQKQIEKLEKMKMALEKENLNLKKQISQLENEKQQYDVKIANMHKRLSEKKNTVLVLQNENNLKDKELVEFKELNEELVKKLNEHQKMIEYYQEMNESVSLEKDKLQKMLQDRLKKQVKDSSVHESQSFSECSSHRKPSQTNEDVPFIPAIQTSLFNFYNIDSPFARRTPKSKNKSTSYTMPEDTNVQNQKKLKITIPLNPKPKLINTCTDLVRYKNINFSKGDSPEQPSLYIVETNISPKRSSESVRLSPRKISFNIQESSSEDELFTRLSIMNNSSIYSPHESLHSELSRVNQDEHHLLKCDYVLQLSEAEKRNFQLQNDLQQLEITNLKKDLQISETKLKEVSKENEDLRITINDSKEHQSIKVVCDCDARKMRRCMEELEYKYKTLENEKWKLELNNEENNARIKELSISINNLNQDRHTELQNEIEESDSLKTEIQKIENERSSLIDDLAQSKESEHYWKTQCDSLKEELQVQDEQIQKLTEENINNSLEFEMLKQAYDRIINDIEYLNVTIRMQVELLNTKEIACEFETDELTNRLEKLSEEYDLIKNQLKRLEEDNETKNKIIAERECLHIAMESKMNLLYDDISKLKAELDVTNQNHIEKIETLNCDLIKSQAELDIRESGARFTKENYEDKIKSYKQKIYYLEKDNVNLKGTNTKLEMKNKELVRFFQSICNGNSPLKKKFRDKILDNTLIEDCYDKELYDIQVQIENSRKQIQNLEEKLVKSAVEINGLKEENNKLKDVNQNSKDTEFISTIHDVIMKLRQSLKQEYEDSSETSDYRDSDIDSTFSSDDSGHIDCSEVEHLLQKYENNFKNRNLEVILEIKLLQESMAKSEIEKKSLKRKLKKNTDKMKKSSYDRMHLRLEKMQEKIDYLQEQVHIEKMSKVILEDRSKNAQKEIGDLIAERVIILKEMQDLKSKKVDSDLSGVYIELYENRRRLKRATYNFAQKWRHHFEQIPSMREILDKIDNEEPSTSVRLYESKFNNELFLLKAEIQLNVNIMERLGEISLPAINWSNDYHTEFSVPIQSDLSKFTLRPPTLFNRPVSPDSPSLESEVSTPVKNVFEVVNSKQSPDSAGISCNSMGSCENSICDGSTLSADNVTELEFQDITDTSIYEDAAMGSFYLTNHFDPQQQINEIKKLTDEELEQKFLTTVLEFTIDGASIKKRLENQFGQMNRCDLELANTTRNFLNLLRTSLTGKTLEQAENLLQVIQRNISNVSHLVEQYGALKYESKIISSINVLINYASVLKRKLENVTKRLYRCTNLQTEVTMVEEYIPSGALVPSPSRPNRSIHVGNSWHLLSMFGVFCCMLLATLHLANLSIFEYRRRGYVDNSINLEDLFGPFVRLQYDGPPPM